MSDKKTSEIEITNQNVICSNLDFLFPPSHEMLKISPGV